RTVPVAVGSVGDPFGAVAPRRVGDPFRGGVPTAGGGERREGDKQPAAGDIPESEVGAATQKEAAVLREGRLAALLVTRMLPKGGPLPTALHVPHPDPAVIAHGRQLFSI